MAEELAVTRKWQSRIPVPGILPFMVSAYLETGYYEIQGAGIHRVSFSEAFDKTPALFKEVIGYWKVLGIRVPMPFFITGVDRSGFNVITLVGTFRVFYLAIGE